MMKYNNFISEQNKFLKIIIFLLAVLSAVFILGLFLGTVRLNVSELAETYIILQLRFDREIAAICCGGMLAIGSAILQGLTRNVIVAPDLIGMTSIGCLLIVTFEIFFFKSIAINECLGVTGAMIGYLLCFSLAKTNHRLVVILIGISISFTATAFLHLLVLKAPENMNDYLHFLTGSLYAINNITAITLVLIAFIMIPITLILAKRFTVLLLDDVTCQSMGVPLKSYRFICFMIAAILIGSSIIGIGHLGFLGIVAPNIARLFVGNRPNQVFPLSFLLGGLLYLLADTLGRCIISPAEIPAGIMTDMLTSPLFLYILFKYYRGHHAWN